ncbi:MAG TPA: hypothetical protein VGI81_28355 [Tepidisphaeraceae bacterium]
MPAFELALFRSFRAWFPLSPGVTLAVLVAVSAVAALIDAIARHRRRRALRALAGRWKMTYSPHDQLRVRGKVIGRLPIPGAADVHVSDVIYGGEGDLYRYVFTAEYTLGAVRAKRRHTRAATFAEPRGRKAADEPGPITLAPEHLPLLEQYEALKPGGAA